MKILAVGCGGFLGSFIVRELQEKGNDVAILDFKPEPADKVPGVTWHQGDVTDFPGVRRIMEEVKPEVVLNMAGLLTSLCARDPFRAVSVNIMGNANILEASRLNGVRRVVFASSAGVCSPDRVDTREETFINPRISMYGATKFLGEVMAREFRKNYGMEVVCLRYSLIYGPGEVATPGNAMRLKTIESCVLGNPVHIDDVHGTDRVHLLHVSDAAHATALAILSPNKLDAVYNVSGVPADFLSFEEIVDILKKICPSAGDVTFSGTGKPVEYGMYLSDKARRDFGFHPRYRAELGLKENAQARLSHK